MWSYLLALLVPLLAIASIGTRHPEIFLVAILIIIPALDFAIGRVKSLPVRCDEKSAAYLVAFHIPHVYQTLWLVMLVVAGYHAVDAPLIELIFIVLCCALMAALVSVPAHEFMHRRCKYSRVAADLLFAMIGYGHYTISHPIHHVNAGLERFGSAPTVGVGVWHYFPRSWINGLKVAWHAEFRKHGYNPLRNRVLRQWGITVVVAVGFFSLWDLRGLVLFGAQAVFAVFFIEAVGYIQHYGFRHKENEPYTHDLAWDSDYWLSNHLLLNNPLHAHHHRNPTAVCVVLEPVAPTLPAGYFSLIWVALVPPLWHSIMKSRIAAAGISHE